MRPADEVKRLRAELREQRRLLVKLARTFYTHARTDLAPEACLPCTRALLEELKDKRSKRS
jgi:hypothetical protein